MLESLTMMIDSDDFVMEGREAIESVRSGLGNPAQQTYFLIAQLGRKAGCARTVTFDQRAAKAGPDMELLT
jgi:predicted nucleic-acid-binding protein